MHGEEKPTFLGLFEKQRAIIVGIIAMTAAFFWGVIIPIQQMRTQLVSIETKLSDADREYDQLVDDHKDFEKRLNIIETKLNVK